MHHCVELPLDLSTPPILENLVTVMNASCDQTTEIPTILSAPIELTVDAKEPDTHFDMTSNLVLILRPMTYCMFAYLSMF